MKNRNAVDKIKDSVFKYSKKGGNSNEINKEYVEQTSGENIQDSNKDIWNRLEDSQKSSFNLAKNSLPTKGWNKYLNKNFKTTGTTTNLNEIKLPTQKKPDNSQNTVMSNIKKYNKCSKIYIET